MQQPELEAFLTAIFKSVGGATAVTEKVNSLAYFETLCSDTAAANILINSSLMTLFVRMAKVRELLATGPAGPWAPKGHIYDDDDIYDDMAQSIDHQMITK